MSNLSDSGGGPMVEVIAEFAAAMAASCGGSLLPVVEIHLAPAVMANLAMALGGRGMHGEPGSQYAVIRTPNGPIAVMAAK